MSAEEKALMHMKGVLFDMPEVHQQKIKSIKAQIEMSVKAGGDEGLIALALCAAELVTRDRLKK